MLRLSPPDRAAVERGTKRAHLTHAEPSWTIGDRVTVVRGWQGDVQDQPLVVVIEDVQRTTPVMVDKAAAALLGYRTLLDWQRAYTGRASGHQLVVEQAVRADTRPVWLTRWTAEVPDVPRILASTLGYTSSLTSPQMRSAGEAVPADYQEQLSAGPSAYWTGERAERALRLRRAREAKRAFAFAESRRRARVRVSRTANSQVKQEQGE